MLGRLRQEMSHTSCGLNSNQAEGDNTSQSLSDPSRSQLHFYRPQSDHSPVSVLLLFCSCLVEQGRHTELIPDYNVDPMNHLCKRPWHTVGSQQSNRAAAVVWTCLECVPSKGSHAGSSALRGRRSQGVDPRAATLRRD